MREPLALLQGTSIRQFMFTTFRKLLPSLVLNVACSLLIYSILHPHFPTSSIIPLLVASLLPLLGNEVSLIRHRQVDIIGILVLMGFAGSITGILLGGSQRLLFIQESFVSGAFGMVGLGSLVFPKPLGYFVAQYVMRTIAPQRRADFGTRWRSCSFRRALRGGTLFWVCSS